MTTQITKGVQLGGKLIAFLPINVDGTALIIPTATVVIDNVSDISMSIQTETGDKVVDKADGVGIIDVHEEDDTLIGVDLQITLGSLDMLLLYTIFGGNVTYDMNGVITGYTFPSISQQRATPKRFSVDVYVPSYTGTTLDGYIIHRYAYCKCLINGYSVTVGDIAKPVITLKARQSPVNGEVQEFQFTTVLPQ